jgi:tetratricopeptide (TPR) repeat protein
MRKEAEYQFGVVQSFLNLSNIAIKLEDYQEARELLIQAITLSQELGTREEIAYCLEGFAAISSHRAQPERAATLTSAAEKVRKDTVATSQNGQNQTLEEIIAYACGESD